MKFLVSPIINWTTPRFLITAFACTLLFVSSAFPALAASNPEKGAVSLTEIQQKAKGVANSEPRSMEEVQAEAKKGINAIQGDADKEKMSTAENSENATSVEEQISNIFSSITGNDK